MPVGFCSIPNGTTLYPTDVLAWCCAPRSQGLVFASGYYAEGRQVLNMLAILPWVSPTIIPNYLGTHPYIIYVHFVRPRSFISTGWIYPYRKDPVADGKSRVTVTVVDAGTGLPLPGVIVSGTIGEGISDAYGVYVSYYHPNGFSYSYSGILAEYYPSGLIWTPILTSNYAVTLQMTRICLWPVWTLQIGPL